LRRLIATNKNAANPANKAYVDGSGTAAKNVPENATLSIWVCAKFVADPVHVMRKEA
jgi:hypothetical protein